MMVEHFGQNPETVPLLLEFLTVLPEEINNYRIPITVRYIYPQYLNMTLMPILGR